MQWLNVLRGCFAAYFAGVVVIGGVNAFISDQGADSIGAVAIFGLMAMIPFTVIALIIWAVLAGMQRRVSAVKAVLICGAVFAAIGLLLAIADGPILFSLVAPAGAFLTGCGFGTAFWLGAFGFAREVQMGRREE